MFEVIATYIDDELNLLLQPGDKVVLKDAKHIKEMLDRGLVRSLEKAAEPKPKAPAKKKKQ